MKSIRTSLLYHPSWKSIADVRILATRGLWFPFGYNYHTAIGSENIVIFSRSINYIIKQKIKQ